MPEGRSWMDTYEDRTYMERYSQDPQTKDWHKLTWEEYQERLMVEAPILVPVTDGFAIVPDIGQTVMVYRLDGSEVLVQITSENYLGFAGYTARGELIVAYSDHTEAPPYSEEERRRDAEEAWEQNTHDLNK